MSCLGKSVVGGGGSEVLMRSCACRLVCGVGELERAKQVLERVLAVDEKAFGSNADEVVATLVNLGSISSDLGENEKAKSLLERAVSLIRGNFGGSDLRLLSSALCILASVHRSLGEGDKANQVLSQALLTRKKLQNK